MSVFSVATLRITSALHYAGTLLRDDAGKMTNICFFIEVKRPQFTRVGHPNQHPGPETEVVPMYIRTIYVYTDNIRIYRQYTYMAVTLGRHTYVAYGLYALLL